MPIELERQTLEWTNFQLTKLGGCVRVFTVSGHCVFCNAMEEIIGRVAGMSDKIIVQGSGFDAEEPTAKAYGIVRRPAILIHGKKDFGLIFTGIPVGYQFGVFVEDLVMASLGSRPPPRECHPDPPHEIPEREAEYNQEGDGEGK